MAGYNVQVTGAEIAVPWNHHWRTPIWVGTLNRTTIITICVMALVVLSIWILRVIV